LAVIIEQISVVTEIVLAEGDQNKEFAIDSDKERIRCLSANDLPATKDNLHICRKNHVGEEAEDWFRFANSKVYDKTGRSENAASASKQIVKEMDGRLYLAEHLDRSYFDSAQYALNPVNYSGVFTGGTDAVYLGDNTPYETTLTFLGEHYLNDQAGAQLIDAGDGAVTDYSFAGGEAAWAVKHIPASRCYNVSATVNGTWIPQYDTCDSGPIAIGYHHPRIDYYVVPYYLTVTEGTLVINAGTVVVGGGGYGNMISVNQGSSFVSQGLQATDGTIEYVRYVGLNRASASPTVPVSTGGTYIGISVGWGATYDIQFSKFEGIYQAVWISGSVGKLHDSILI